MGDQTGAGRPRNPDGTVNWAVVFEDPDKGILSAFEKASSVDHLEALISQISTILFQRKNDSTARAEFIKRMNGILQEIDEIGFEETREHLLDILKAEKATRIQKAKEYLANKHAGQSIDRRESSWSLGFKSAFFGSPTRTMSTLGVLVFLITLGFFTHIKFDKPEIDIEAGKNVEEEKTKEVVETEPADPVETRSIDNEIRYPVLMMTPIVVRTTKGRQSLVPVIVVPDLDETDDLCRFAPKFTENALFKTSAAAETKKKISARELRSIASSLRKETNAKLEDNFIRVLYLIELQKFDQGALRAAYRGCGKHQLKVNPKDLQG